MGLTKLRNYIIQSDARNSDEIYGEDRVVGLSTQKQMILTKADLSGVNLCSYKLFPPHYFAYVPDTSRRGDKMSLVYNSTEETYLVSSISVVFSIENERNLISDYLFMYFNRPEFDRYTRFHSWGSARETFSWEEMCDIEIELPSIDIQQKYVNIYKAMVANQQSYERGLEDLKLSIDAIIERFKYRENSISLGEIVEESDVRNSENTISVVHGVNKDKVFMPSVASGEDLSKYKIVQKGQFACNLMHVGRDVAVPVALHKENKPIIVSPAYLVFNLINDTMLPEFVMMWLSRSETDRYAWFLSDTNVRSGMEKKRFYEMEIPMPDIQRQKALVELYNVLVTRRNINEKLKQQIKNLCPILIKGSLQ